MGALTQYAIQVAPILAAFYLVYKWTLASASFHRFNRAVLLTGLGIALGAIPIWTHFQDGPIEALDAQMAGIDSEGGSIMETTAPIWPKAIIIAYLSGVLVSLCITARQAAKIWRIISCGTKFCAGRYTIVCSQSKNIAPFSWGKWIVLPSTVAESDWPTIIEHEKYHLRHLHWVDLAVYQCVIIFNWFNPAAYLLMKEIQDAHEFEVDADIIATGRIVPKEYQILLLRNVIGLDVPHFTDRFSHSRLKARLRMMQASPTNPMRRMLAISIIPMMCMVVFAMGNLAIAAPLAAIKETALTRASINEVHYNILPCSGGGEKHSISYLNRYGFCMVSMDVAQDTPVPKIYIDGKISVIGNLTDINPETIDFIMADTKRNRFVIKTM